MLAIATKPRRSVHAPQDGVDGGPLAVLVHSRPTRVGLLIVACVLMGLTDLACTLAYVGGIGMIEVNPVARLIIREGGAFWLIFFKLMTMVVTGACVYASRKHRMGEQCAWLCFLMLMTLTLHWVRYNEQVVSPEVMADITLIAASPEAPRFPHWVSFAE